MKVDLTDEQIKFIKESLDWTKFHIGDHDYTYGHPENDGMREFGRKRKQKVSNMVSEIKQTFREERKKVKK